MDWYYFDISSDRAQRIDRIAKPLSSRLELYVPPVALCVIALVVCDGFSPLHGTEGGIVGIFRLGGHSPLHGFEDAHYDSVVFRLLLAAVFLIVLDAGQLLWTWLQLKKLLFALSRHRFRRSFSRLRDSSWQVLWRGSNVLRSRRLNSSQRMVAARQLKASLENAPGLRPARDKTLSGLLEAIVIAEDAQMDVVKMDAITEDRRENPKLQENRAQLRQLQELAELKLTDVAGAALRFLLPTYGRETDWDDPDLHVAQAEEFVCRQYLSYIQNVVGRVRTLALSIIGVFLFAVLSMMVYPFDRRRDVVLALGVLLGVVGSVVSFVYAGMYRDATLSRITDKQPDRLGADFWLKLAGFLTVPLLSILAARFPEVNEFLFSWLERSLDRLH